MTSAGARALAALLEAPLAPCPPLPPGEFVVYGAGNAGREVAEALGRSGRPPVCFLDRSRTGTVAGLPIHAPESPAATALARAGLPVAVAVFNHTADPAAITATLGRAGWRSVVGFAHLREALGLAPRFWLGPREAIAGHRGRITEAFGALGDAASRRLFLEALQMRLTLDLAAIGAVAPQEQYVPRDVVALRGPQRFVDGGAFVGDTLEHLLARGVEFAAVAAFEPDRASFARLRATVERRAAELGEVALWPCGLADAAGTAAFHADAGAASAVGVGGTVEIRLVALDDVAPAFAPTYLKLDVEGSEAAALAGAARTLERFRPQLAVCAYHRPTDLWEIPLLLRELAPEKPIFLRAHGYQGFDLVAYAVNRDRAAG